MTVLEGHTEGRTRKVENSVQVLDDVIGSVKNRYEEIDRRQKEMYCSHRTR